jgi:carboxypeptidase C (cathepsin A)
MALMRTKSSLIPFVLMFSSFVASAALAADEPASPAPPAEKVAPREFVTHHKVTIGKELLSYTAVAGETILVGPDGAQEASIFSIAYVKDGLDRPEARPITFVFNGGPGSSSVWLHLGAFGPRRLSVSSDPVNPGGPPYELADNPYTLLRHSDLVFVDPVGTGYSRALGKKKDKEYWGVDEDSASVARFIRSYLTTNKRWNSPKYLLGESYGTTRAAVLIRDLELKLLDSVTFNGVVLLSVAVDVRPFVDAGPGNELPYVTDLPTYAATAYFHHALPQQPADLDAFLRQVEEFAGTEYLMALFKGDSLPADRQQAIAEKLHQFTGLSTEYLKHSRLRIGQGRFVKELLRGRGLVLGLHDTRFAGKDPDDAGEGVQNDPFLLGVSGPFVATINDYLSRQLDVKIQQPYIALSVEANEAWRRAGNANGVFAGYLVTTDYLARAAATNKDFRIFAASGIHDLTTAYYGTQYVFEHSGIDKSQLTVKNYVGGHMMYMYLPSLQQLSEDIGAFMKGK